nr:hypothetical protein [Actinomycetota bacterium]
MAAPPHPPAPDFDSWVDARAHTLSRFAYALTGSADEADEVVQEALAAAHAHWHRTGGAEPAEEDLLATMVRAYLRRARRGRRTPPAEAVDALDLADDRDGSDPWLPTPTFGGGPGPDETARWQRCADLTAPQRAALVLYALEGLGTVETAAVMGCRHKSAETALAQAVEQLPPASDGARPVPRREAERAALAATGHALRQYAELAPRAYSPAD